MFQRLMSVGKTHYPVYPCKPHQVSVSSSLAQIWFRRCLLKRGSLVAVIETGTEPVRATSAIKIRKSSGTEVPRSAATFSAFFNLRGSTYT